MSDPRSLVGHIDAVTPTLQGWVGLDGGTTEPQQPILLSLELGQHRLGTLAPTIDRPDVDEALGYGGGPKGLRAEVAAITAFAHLTRSAGLSLVAENPEAPTPLRLAVPATQAPSLQWAQATQGWAVRDVWLSTSRHLSLRFEAATQAPACRILAFQTPARPDGVPVRLPVSGSLDGSLGLVCIGLLNPFLPVLLLKIDAADVVLSCDWLPFPSLARGGLHHPEVQCLAEGGNLLSVLSSLSDRLVEGLVERRVPDEARSLLCDRLVFDSQGSTGTEPMFDADLTDMITGHLGVSIKVVPTANPDAGSAPEASDRLRAQIRNAPIKPSPDCVAMHIGADAAPTLSALILPYLFEAGVAQPDPAHAVVTRDDDPAAWLVTPSTDGADGQSGAPRIKAAPTMIGSVHIAAPVAVRRPQRPTRIGASNAFPTATDDDMGLSAREPLSVLVLPADGASVSPAALLQSIAEQVHCPIAQILFVLNPGQDPGAVEPLLQTLFPDRHTLLTIDGHRGQMDVLRYAAGHADQTQIAVVARDTVLHDPRTLAALATALDDPGVGTAACTLIHQDANASRFAAAGYFLKTIDFRNQPSIVFDTPDARRILGDRYSVVAGPLSVLVTRKGVLQSLPASMSRSDRRATEDVRFGLEVLRLGYRNIVTTRVSATTTRTDLTAPRLFATLPFDFGMAFLQRIAAATTGLSRL